MILQIILTILAIISIIYVPYYIGKFVHLSIIKDDNDDILDWYGHGLAIILFSALAMFFVAIIYGIIGKLLLT